MAKLKIIHSRTLVVEELYTTTIEVDDDFDIEETNLLFILRDEDWTDPVEVDVIDNIDEDIIEWEWV